LARNLKTEAVFRIVILHVPLRQRHGIPEFGANALKGVLHPMFAGFYVVLWPPHTTAQRKKEGKWSSRKG
jgi:hypothetical protein